MAPNKRGGPPSSEGMRVTRASRKARQSNGGGDDGDEGGVISKAEVEARGSGTKEDHDTYDSTRRLDSEKRVFFTGLMFLTRLPCPGYCDHHPAYLMRSLQWFPLIGTIIGIWSAVWLQAADVLWSPAIAAACSTLATVWLTGCFHEDGLADCFDGFGGGWGRLQILRIMKDSRIGTYALVGMSLILSMKLRSLDQLLSSSSSSSSIDAITITLGGGIGGMLPFFSLQISQAMAALIAAHTASRWTSLPLIYFCHYIQDEEDAKRGLYNWFAQSKRLLTPIRLVIGTATAITIPYYLLGQEKAMMIYATIVCITLFAGYYANLVIGGVVGDYLGATIQVAELGCYLVLTADFQKASRNWEPLALLVIVALMPIIYSRKVVDYGNC